VLCVVGYDVFGYLVGSQFGKRRSSPTSRRTRRSKGLVGGMIASSVALVIVEADHPVGRPHRRACPRSRRRGDGARSATSASRCSKRRPRREGLRHAPAGHGGVLDRFDAILFCLPAVYYLASRTAIG
jgi:phosphatidate cytidylyltransferase